VTADEWLAHVFDVGHAWGDIAHVMSLTLDEVALYAVHIQRIRRAQPG
jgi:hypothetical protein